MISASTAFSQDSELAPRIERFAADSGSLERTYPVRLSETRSQRLKSFFESALSDLRSVDFDKLSHDGQVDYLLLQNHVRHELRELDIESGYRKGTEPYLSFAGTIIGLEEERRKFSPIDSAKSAITLNALEKQIRETQKKWEAELGKKPAPAIDRTVANRAAGSVQRLREHLEDWFKFYNGYDPLFTWWCAEPQKGVVDALNDYQGFLRERLVGIRPDDTTTIIGFPIGRDALLAELEFEMIPYTPDELVELANKEFAWCEAEMKKASRELGFGDDWKKALEHVKNLHEEPGKQPQLIRELAYEAIEFLEQRDLLTIPALAKETWRMEMMSPQAQLQSPFFLGGELIQVSFPTNTMAHEAKLMSMRGNNRYFSRATVHHELIPGHHLQQFMTSRYKPYRRVFGTPFWTEGWALYWEFQLYDMGFAKTPEQRIGMLFWRMHRCARIIFSLSFHLGKMTPQECVDFLVDRVGHERDNASAEVRRSFAGNYGPLYQAAYMLGGQQIWAMHRELVQSRKMTNRQFHDAILQNNSMPIEMVRATLTKQKLAKDFAPSWRFYRN